MVLRPELIPKFLFEDSLKVGEEITRMPRPRLIFIIFIFVPNFPKLPINLIWLLSCVILVSELKINHLHLLFPFSVF